MRRKDKLPELLAPAGDFDCLVAAVRGGADAVYVGGKLYSARAYAKNFDLETLSRAVAYCHLHGVRLYVTINTLLYNKEMPEALEFARSLYLIGVDALIVADLGLVRALREYLPEMELHASTQMSVHNSYGADVAYSLGCTRVVLARELTGENMRRVTEACKPECEVFLHGALCVCHSGQCLFSSIVGGRSGNRGECAQPCRLPYDGKYPLSLSDLSLAGHVRELIDSGVASLKIEGRMKSPEYVYTVTSIYRKLLDEGRDSVKAENKRLEAAFSRGGFTDGYFKGTLGERMTGVRSEEDKERSRSIAPVDFTPDRVAVRAEVELHLGEPSKMTLTPIGVSNLSSVTVTGDMPDVAKNAPLDAVAVKARLAKMGNTFLSLSEEDIALDMDEGINLSPAALNALRRAAAAVLESPERSLPERRFPCTPEKSTRPTTKHRRTAIFYDPEQLTPRAASYFDLTFVPLHRLEECDILPNGVAMPPVIMEDELDDVREMLKKAKSKGIMYTLVGNLGHLPLAKETGMEPVADFRFNIMSSYSSAAIAELGIDVPMLSPELTYPEAREIGGRELAYGRIPLMLTERCFISENFGCDRCGKSGFTDRMGKKFPILREYKHRNIIFNSAVTYTADKPIDGAGLYPHFIFSTESCREVDRIIDAYEKRLGAPSNMQIRRIGKRTK